MAKAKYLEWLEPDKLILLEGWARDGLTEQQICHNIGISTTALYKWKNNPKCVDLVNALKKGKEVADFEVENALYKRAIGYKITVKKPIKVRTEKQLKDKGKIVEEHVQYVDEEAYIPPDTTAQIYWLKNRMPEKWRDKRIVEDHVEFESDGFIEALKAQSGETFKEGDSIVEE